MFEVIQFVFIKLHLGKAINVWSIFFPLFENVSMENEQFFIPIKCLISLSKMLLKKERVRCDNGASLVCAYNLCHAHFNDSVFVLRLAFLSVSATFYSCL